MNDAIEVSLFIAPNEKQIAAARAPGASLWNCTPARLRRNFKKAESRRTGRRGRTLLKVRPRLSTLALDGIAAVDFRRAAGARARLKVNAGHGLNYVNLPALHRVPHLVELNIGHSIISRAVSVGLEKAVKEMLRLMKNYRG